MRRIDHHPGPHPEVRPQGASRDRNGLGLPPFFEARRSAYAPQDEGVTVVCSILILRRRAQARPRRIATVSAFSIFRGSLRSHLKMRRIDHHPGPHPEAPRASAASKDRFPPNSGSKPRLIPIFADFPRFREISPDFSRLIPGFFSGHANWRAPLHPGARRADQAGRLARASPAKGR